MKRIFLALTSTTVLAGLLVALSPTPAAQACSCAPSTSAAAYAKNADAVFTGTVVGEYRAGSSHTYVLDVDTVYKGTVHERQAVRTATSTAACGTGLGSDIRYVVFGSGSDPLLIGACDRTRRASEVSYDLDNLGQPTEPRTGDSPGTKAPLWHPARWIPGPTGSVWPTVLAGVGAGGLVGGVVVLVRRRER